MFPPFLVGAESFDFVDARPVLQGIDKGRVAQKCFGVVFDFLEEFGVGEIMPWLRQSEKKLSDSGEIRAFRNFSGVDKEELLEDSGFFGRFLDFGAH